MKPTFRYLPGPCNFLEGRSNGASLPNWPLLRSRRPARGGRTRNDRGLEPTSLPGALRAPIILVWDNVNTHVCTVMRKFLDAHHDWLTVVRLPAYAPDLNPAEGVWANVKNDLGSLAAHGVDPLAAVIRNRLKRIQYRPELLPSFLAQTGLSFPTSHRSGPQTPGLSRSVGRYGGPGPGSGIHHRMGVGRASTR